VPRVENPNNFSVRMYKNPGQIEDVGRFRKEREGRQGTEEEEVETTLPAESIL
jgi:hypothetical protein